MDKATIQGAIKDNYPLDMTYQRARNVRYGNGRKRISHRRWVGYSSDHSLSVEMVGNDDNLRYTEFMIGLASPTQAGAATYAAVKVLEMLAVTWGGEEWLRERILEMKGGKSGKVHVKFMTMPTKPPLPVLFLRVTR